MLLDTKIFNHFVYSNISIIKKKHFKNIFIETNL